MSVTPIDRTDQRIIQLVSELGDPLVGTQDLAEAVDLGFQATRDRLQDLEEQGWVAGQPGDGQQVWQVSSKASLLVRTDSEPPGERGDEDIIDAEAEAEANGGDDVAGEGEEAGADAGKEEEDEDEPD
jgi:DNA-binding FadR family transcriptional regulator